MNAESLRHYWRSLGRAGVVSVPGFLLVVLLLVVRATLTQVGSGTPLLAETLLAPESLDTSQGVASTVAAAVGAAVVMLVARATVLRQRPVNPWVTVCVYIAIVVVMSAGRAFVNERSIFDGAEFVARLVLGLLWVTIISMALDARAEQVDALGQLTARRSRLELLQRQSEKSLASLRRRLRDLVDVQVAPAVRSMIAALRNLQGSTPETSSISEQLLKLAQQIRDFGDKTVRELSHQLDQASNEPFDPDLDDGSGNVSADTATPKKSRQFLSLLRDSTYVRPFNALLTSATLLMTMLPTLIVGVGITSRGAAVGIVGCGTAYACLTLAEHFVAPRLRSLGSWFRAFGCLVVYLVTSVTAYTVQALLLDPALPPRFIVVITLGLILVGGAWSLAAAVSEHRRRARLDLAAAIAAIDWQTTQTGNRLRATRQETVRLLHGDIQSRLAAVGMRLDFAAEQGDSEGVDDAINQSVQALDSVLVSLSRVAAPSSQRTNVIDSLDAIASSWNNAMAVTFTCDDDAVHSIVSHSLESEVIEVAREATLNAARHGMAKHVNIAITARADSIHIAATDDGIGAAASTTSGLGLASLTRLGATWKLERRDPNGTCLTVELPTHDIVIR